MDAIVKNLNFGEDARVNVFKGIEKLTKAVSSTLGASGKCVMLEDHTGNPIITKDGVTVADSIILRDPVENMGATLLKQAARKTATQTRARILDDAIALKSEWEKANPGKDFRSSPIYQNYENMIIQATQGKITTLSEARQTAFDIMMTNEDFAGTYQLWALTPAERS